MLAFLRRYCFVLIILICSGVTVYAIRDNSRFVIVNQEIEIPALPEAFDGYTILQITDLHSARFGKNQKNLTGAINEIPYDMIAITGDMQTYSGNMEPYLELLRGIKNKDLLVCISGNSGPADVDYSTGLIIDQGKQLQKEGCRLLDRPIKIDRNGDHIWLAELLYNRKPEDLEWMGALAGKQGRTIDPARIAQLRLEYQAEITGIFNSITQEDVLIGITHFPVTKSVLDEPVHARMQPYDLIIAGHYHGGQIRIPFIGALIIPNASENHRGFLPDPKIVSGLYSGNGMQQYVSRGLGAGGPVPFLRFRLFNTPEINLLTLRAAD